MSLTVRITGRRTISFYLEVCVLGGGGGGAVGCESLVAESNSDTTPPHTHTHNPRCEKRSDLLVVCILISHDILRASHVPLGYTHA